MSRETESELEERLGLPAAVLALWRPDAEPPDLVLDDAWYIRKSARTRRRIAALHVIASGVLNGQHLAASAELDRLGPVSLVLATVRGLLLSGDLLGDSPSDEAAIRNLCATASDRAQRLGRESGRGHDQALLREAIRVGARMFYEVFASPTNELPLLLRVTDSLSPSQEHRYGIACVCIAGYASVLEAHDPTGRDARALAEEQAALAFAYAQGGIVRWNDGKLVLHE